MLRPGSLIPCNQAVNSFGLHSFTILEKSSSELCYGLQGRFWRADFGLENVPNANAYQTSAMAGARNFSLRYRVAELKKGQYELCTETFIYSSLKSQQYQVQIFLTDKGRALLKASHKCMDVFQSLGLSLEEVLVLQRAMIKVRNNLLKSLDDKQ